MPRNRTPTRFWNYEETPAGEPAVLRLEGVISSESWFDDDVTPKMFREELEAHPGNIVVYINSPGGDVIAGSQIYTMLMEHKGSVTIKIDGLAASAASVIAMAGTEVLMAPTAYMMIHNAWSWAIGNSGDMMHEAEVLEEIDKGIRTAYHIKTGLSDRKLAEMMEDETWMSARTCIDMGFADGYIGGEKPEEPEEPEEPDDPDEDDPDNVEHLDDRAAALRAGFPAVAFSRRRQFAALLREVAAVDRRASEGEKKPEADDTERLRLQLKLA